MMFSLKPIVASRGYHVYKEASWSNAKLNIEVKVELETDAKSLSTDPYACAIKARHSYFVGWKTAGHIPREISRYVYFFYQRRKCKSFWNSKVVEIQCVTDSFWRIRSSSLIDIFVQGKMGCRYHGGIHSKFLHFRILRKSVS